MNLMKLLNFAKHLCNRHISKLPDSRILTPKVSLFFFFTNLWHLAFLKTLIALLYQPLIHAQLPLPKNVIKAFSYFFVRNFYETTYVFAFTVKRRVVTLTINNN